MLPPKVVPGDLDVLDYQRLMLRYQALVWLSQMSFCSKQVLRLSPEGSIPEAERRKMLALMTAVQASVFVTDTVTGVQETASDLVKYAAGEGGRLLDKNELTRKAKDKAVFAFDFVGKLAGDTVHKVLEDVVLPHVGLPVHYVPEGGSARQYLTMAERFEKLGYVEPMRKALQRAIACGGAEGERAKVLSKTRLPLREIRNQSMSKFLDALKFIYTKKESQARPLLLELLRDEAGFDWVYPRLALIELSSGEEERARDLMARLIKENANSIFAYSTLVTIELASWQIGAMEKHVNKLLELDSVAPETIQAEQIFSLICQTGLR